MRSFCFVNLSCYRRQEEIAAVRRFLFFNEYVELGDLARVDLVVLFTCAFCQSKVADMLSEVRRIRAAIGPDCRLVVGSCLPATDGDGLRSLFDGMTVTPTDFRALDALPGIKVPFAEVPKRPEDEISCAPLGSKAPLWMPRGRLGEAVAATARCLMRAWPGLRLERMATRINPDKRMGVFISAGCRRNCAYCAIRFATGALRSKPLEVVARIFEEGLGQGYRRFEIYADSIGDYGLDRGTDLGTLFDWLLGHPRPFSVGIYDLHPQAFLKFYDRIRALCAGGRVHYLYVPLQSGNDRILSLMRRPCDLASLKEKLLAIRRMGGVFLQTSIIVGFPTETRQEFEDTVAFLEVVRFSDVYVHFYSDMPNTESSRMPGKIGKEIMLERMSRLGRTRIHHHRGSTRHEWENIPSSN